jgi:hypothetical protein
MGIAPTSAPGSALAGSDALAAARAIRRVSPVQPGKATTPPQPVIGGNVMVSFDRHKATGAQVVRFIDKRTGETINQLPAEQVLDAVSALMEMFRKREA